MNRYALHHRLSHLLAVDRVQDAAQLLLDPAYLEAKVEQGLVFDLAAEYESVLARLPLESPSHRLLKLIERSIRYHISILSRDIPRPFSNVFGTRVAGTMTPTSVWATQRRRILVRRRYLNG